jgi:hypothetical protein
MALPGLVAAQNLADVADRERAWDNLGLNIVFPGTENFDPDTIDYLSRVAIADGGLLELPVASAINSFIVGCKSDGIWPAIKASCILAGARTLTGALVPLVGAAPTNVDGLFVAADYNRKAGLIGNGSTKRLNSNRRDNADPLNSAHVSAFVTEACQFNGRYVGVFSGSAQHREIGVAGGSVRSANISFNAGGLGFSGINRANGTQATGRTAGVSTLYNVVSVAPVTDRFISVFSTLTAFPFSYSSARLAFYSIGESLDLALLDARVTTLINAFAAAIP